METKLSPEQIELYNRIDEVLFYIWDPIGVAETPQARNEYYGYVTKILQLVLNSTPANIIAEYLIQIETEAMGLDNSKKSRANATKTAELLIKHYEWIKQKDSLNLSP